MDCMLHPRPQFARPNWIDLRGEWGFAYDDADTGLAAGWQGRIDVFGRHIIVPFPPESPASEVGDSGFHPVVWYRRTFRVSPKDAGKRLILHFGAVDYRAQVWVNERLVADHFGGNTPFSADITDALVSGGEQTIVLRAEDRPDDLAQPRGKQDWHRDPHKIWYQRTTGIWQPVWIEPVSDVHISELGWTPHLERHTLGIRIRLSRRDAAPIQLHVRLTLHGEVLADDTYSILGTLLEREIALDAGRLTMDHEEFLWTPWHPNLIDAEVTVLRDSEVIDQVGSYAGMRSIGVHGGQFLLNGHPYFLRMVLHQGYWPESHLAAPSDEALYREVELARSLGFNGLRIHQKVEDPRLLYWCDRLGMLVWGEMANAYAFSKEGVEALTHEWPEVVARDRSHPCIVAWVPINESWGVHGMLQDPAQQHLVRALYHLTKTLDPTRPVVANDGWEYVCGDVIGVHDYTFSGAVLRHRYGSDEAIQRTLHHDRPGHHFILLAEPAPGTPIVLSEFGGISYAPPPDNPDWFGYDVVESAEAYLAKYRELLDAVFECPGLAGFCYTQLADTAQETNGLLTADRRPKLNLAQMYAITCRAPLALPGPGVVPDV